MTTCTNKPIVRICQLDGTVDVYQLCGNKETVQATVTYYVAGELHKYTGNIYRLGMSIVVSDGYCDDYILCEGDDIVEIRKAVL